jgi:hypothetical protein
MGIISRLMRRSTGDGGAPAPSAAPGVVIAERFVSPYDTISALLVPGAIAERYPGRDLAAIIMDASGDQTRDGALASAVPGQSHTEIGFAPFAVAPHAPLWLFVLDAADITRFARPELVRLLLLHARPLGSRPPIELTCIAVPSSAGRRPSPVSSPESDAGVSKPITFAMLSEDPDPKLLPRLDQPDVDAAGLTAEQRAWRSDGVVILPRFLPDSVIDPYIRLREKFGRARGWDTPTPYLQIPELRHVSLYPPLRAMLRELIGEEMMLHLNLTGWVSTERDWHQDDYLNPGTVNSWYAAVWIALGDIHPDSGPFEYIPGSHRWPLLRGEKVRACMTGAERAASVGSTGFDAWPTITEKYLVPAIEAEIHARGIAPRQFLGRKGDVLIWHGRLMHRGTRPNGSDLERRALIAHYSGVTHRPDMPRRRTEKNGGVYAVFDHELV